MVLVRLSMLQCSNRIYLSCSHGATTEAPRPAQVNSADVINRDCSQPTLMGELDLSLRIVGNLTPLIIVLPTSRRLQSGGRGLCWEARLLI